MLHLRGQYTLKNKKYKINKNFNIAINFAAPKKITKSFVNECKEITADEISQEITDWLLNNFCVNEYEEIRVSSNCSPCVEDIKITKE